MGFVLNRHCDRVFPTDILVYPVSVSYTGAPYPFFRLSPRLDSSAVDSVYITRTESGGGYRESLRNTFPPLSGLK